jgi:drug/metabolite transporter (DMT)-like permease
VIAVVLGAVILGEPLDTRIAAAAGMVLAGVAIVRLGSGGKKGTRGATR